MVRPLKGGGIFVKRMKPFLTMSCFLHVPLGLRVINKSVQRHVQTHRVVQKPEHILDVPFQVQEMKKFRVKCHENA